ncbi:hypothetical protein [Candidatus Leptofilum sp.]|uniref:hypothetical protein n=1 Tax=Candidatus Leptofilum sp. TaxID=3241576 RepID=UPI003B59C25B
MRTKNYLPTLRFLFYTTLLQLLVLCSCAKISNTTENQSKNLVHQNDLANSVKRPNFVLDVSPQEFEAIPLSLYSADLTDEYYDRTGAVVSTALGSREFGFKSEVCLEISLGTLAQVGDDFSENSSILERIKISINNEDLTDVTAGHMHLVSTDLVNSEGEILMSGVGDAVACGKALLAPGLQEVTFEFRQTSGEIKSYSWQFEIIEQPNFVQKVSPQEFESIPLSIYSADLTDEYYERTGIIVYSALGSRRFGFKSKVCIEIRLGVLAQVGDDFSEDSSISERIKISINNEDLTDITAGHSSLELINIGNLEGEILKRGVGDAVACGKALLAPGLQEVTFEFQQTSGEIKSYSWQFELTEG